MELKNIVKNTLFNSHFCSICLENSEILFKFSDDVVISIENDIYKSNLKSILQELLGRKILHTTVTDYICGPCKDIVTNFFIFKHKTLKNVEIYQHFIYQMDTKVDELSDYFSEHTNVLGSTFIVLDEPPNYYKKLVVNHDKINDEMGIVEDESLNYFQNLNIENGKFNKEVKVVTPKKKDKCFICDCCNVIFQTRGGIYRHLIKGRKKKYIGCCTEIPCPHQKYRAAFRRQRKMKQPLISCIDCNFQCRTFQTLITHVNAVHLDIKHMCSICGFVTNNWERFNSHRRKCGKLECPYCHLLFTDKDNSEAHMKLCKSVNGKFQCDHCNISCSTKNKLTKHIKIHAETYICDQCGKKFVRRSILKSHWNSIHKKNNLRGNLTHTQSKTNEEKFCKEDFNMTNEFLAHLKKDSQKRVKKSDILVTHRKLFLKCSICDKDCHNHKKLEAHLLTHGPKEKHKCKPCKKKFNTRLLYLRHTSSFSHLKVCYPNDKGLFKCQQCDFITIYAKSMRQHISQRHAAKSKVKEIAEYECQHCHKTFKKKQLYRDHIKSHTVSKMKEGIRPLDIVLEVCDICGKVLKSSVALKRHRRLHTGEKPYACKLCDMFFVSTGHRTAHVLREHTEKSEECPICCKLFFTVAKVREHVIKAHWKSEVEFDYRKLPCNREKMEEIFKD